MGMKRRIVNPVSSLVTDKQKRQKQAGRGADHRSRIAAERHAERGAGNCCGQRQNIGQIGAFPDTAGWHGDGHMITDLRADVVGNAILPGCAAEHLGQLLAAAAALFMATPATALLHLNQCDAVPKFTDDRADRALLLSIHDLPPAIGRDVEQGAQLQGDSLAGPENTRTDSADRAVHHAGNFLVGKPFDFTQDDRGP